MTPISSSIGIRGPHCSKLPVAPGLLCVTCTDLAVLATNNYPEKWYVLILTATFFERLVNHLHFNVA